MTFPEELPPAAVGSPAATGAILRRGGARRDFFRGLTAASAMSSVVLLLAITLVVTTRAFPAYREFGWDFLWRQQWNPITDQYGALPFVFGTLVSSFLALAVAIPLGLAVGIALSEDILPLKLRLFFGSVVELLASIPSVIYGLWGLAVVIPLTTRIGQWLFMSFHDIPIFSTPPAGPGMLPASLVLGIMVLPTIATLSRSTLRNVPAALAEGAYALGATRWDVLLHIKLPNAWTGIFGAVVLALGRAMGETMALAMLVGNNNRISFSLLAPGNTIASLLANSFGEASGLHLSALMYLSFILMAMTLLINVVAQVLLSRNGDVRQRA